MTEATQTTDISINVEIKSESPKTKKRKAQAGINTAAKLNASIDSVGFARLRIQGNLNDSRNEWFDTTENGVEKVMDYIFSGDPEAVNPLQEFQDTFNTESAHLDERTAELTARAKR